jgi:hypothetical protein
MESESIHRCETGNMVCESTLESNILYEKIDKQLVLVDCVNYCPFCGYSQSMVRVVHFTPVAG